MAARADKASKQKSINLEDYEEEDEKENFSDYDGDDVDEEERWKKDDERYKSDPKMCWKIGGATKDRALTRLIKNFSNLVVEIGDDNNDDEDDDDDTDNGPTFDNGGRSRNRQCSKGIKALDLVKKTTLFLRNYDNEETKDFTIFLAKNQIIQSKLTQLLELCAEDDDIPLAMECCKLLLVLGRMHHPKNDSRLVVKLPGKSAKETKEESEKRYAKESSKRDNLLKQKSAMLCIKEAFCTEKSAKIIMSAFSMFMEKELAKPSEDAESQKVVDGPYNNLFRCLRYLRIMLEVDSVPTVSTESECSMARRTQCKLVIYYKSMLSAIPAILSDINRKPYRGSRYHDTWLVDVILIIYTMLRGHTPRDLYRVCAAGGLQGDDEVVSKGVRVPDAIANRAVLQVCQKGVLKNKLLQERQKTVSRDLGSRKGNFVIPLSRPTVQFTAPTPFDDDDDADTKQKSTAPTQMHIRNPFGTGDGPRVHQAKLKRTKKKTTFDIKEQLDKTSCDSYSDSMEREGPKASVVVANIVDRICNTGLRELVLRVNDDLRREENIISSDEQLAYFKILSTCMHYNRLKKDAEKRRMASAERPWAPDVRNVIHALDTMSWNRVIVCMETLFTAKQFKDIHVPMELYKEMICYIKLMLDSADINHHEIAIARLYRLFFSVSRERQDPLAILLRQWKPATYGPKHLNCLVELVHETLKTLETARERFNKYSTDDKKKLRKKGKDVDIETYISSCLRFDIDDYFQRIVNYQNISIYTRLLAKMESNPPHINYYVYSFLKRMNNFRLEQELKAPMPPSAPLDGAAASPSQSGEVNLAYMLFNVSSLHVISSVLNNPILANQKENYEMMTLLKIIVRRFFEAAKKNHMLFVEALFHHPHCHDFVLQLDNVYEAPAYLTTEKSKGYGRGARSDSDSSSGSSSDEEEAVRAKEDFGDAFDEADLGDAFKLTKKKKEKERKEKKEKKKERQQKKVASARGGRVEAEDVEAPVRGSSRIWSPEEDAVVRSVYAQYAGTSAVFDMIAGSQALVDLGRNRTSKQVAKRARELKLHLTLNNDESDDEPPAARRAQKVTAGGGAKAVKANNWSKDEDSALEKLYRMHRGSSNVFVLVSQDKLLKSYGMKRSADDVEGRVQALKLYLQGEDSDNDGGAGDASDPAAPDRPWVDDEDEYLRELYQTYGDLPNAFDIIAEDHSFELVHVDGRSPGEIERRVHELRLDPSRDYEQEEQQKRRSGVPADELDLDSMAAGGDALADRLRDWEEVDDAAAVADSGRKHLLTGGDERAGQGRVRKMQRTAMDDDDDIFGYAAPAADAENVLNQAPKGRKMLVDSDDE